MRLSQYQIAFLFLTALASAAQPIRADVRLAGLFADHMVLQEGRKTPIWGWADAGEPIAVNFAGQTLATNADARGKWRVDLLDLTANQQPQQLVVAGKNIIRCEDVLVGDVWLCSGQSNMEYGYQNLVKTSEMVEPQIRTFCVLKSASLTPLDDTLYVPRELVNDTEMGHWQKEEPGGPWGGFSAVGYFFGKEIHKFTGKPVGLIGSYWGGTPAQAWTSLSGLEKEPRLSNYVEEFRNLSPAEKAKFPVKWADYVAAMRSWELESLDPYQHSKSQWEAAARKAREAGQPEPPQPQMAFPRPANPGNVGTTTSLFNGMIHPLIPCAIKGVIWYQGESNAYNGEEYGVLFPTLIKDWRAKWGQGDFPFLSVQVAAYGVPTSDPTRDHWPALREGQTKALALPNTAMAVAIDIGDKKEIHPKNKMAVAHRLALAAEHLAYGKNIVCSGPTYESIKSQENLVRVTFANTGSGLMIGSPPPLPGSPPDPPAAELKGFEIAGANRQWFIAKATIDGSDVLVSSDQVPQPVAVRYAWGDFPSCNLYNKEALPAVPFRTDDWDPKAAFSTPQ